MRWVVFTSYHTAKNSFKQHIKEYGWKQGQSLLEWQSLPKTSESEQEYIWRMHAHEWCDILVRGHLAVETRRTDALFQTQGNDRNG